MSSQGQSGHPLNGDSGPQQMDFGGPSHPFPQPERQLGSEVLAALRSTRGGIYYRKISRLKEVHYVDQYPIYTCAFPPQHMVHYNESENVSTELGQGLIRKEALDLLGYSYTYTGNGQYSLPGDLELVRGIL